MFHVTVIEIKVEDARLGAAFITDQFKRKVMKCPFNSYLNQCVRSQKKYFLHYGDLDITAWSRKFYFQYKTLISLTPLDSIC